MSLRDEAIATLGHRAKSYHRVFLGHGVDTDRVLTDLAKFCRAHESTFHLNPAAANRLDGRREVWLRIQQHLQLTDDQLWSIYGNQRLPTEEE